ncbi:unnamed protein product [Brugia pahangi]|uniref:Protein kinase domain-containing protein n=1 Tax=Brugia pahangi TaxID=6280 RepID=A0A3P7SCB1_BRUPA|nr:unnamed protein product [Brugia pahangi]
MIAIDPLIVDKEGRIDDCWLSVGLIAIDPLIVDKEGRIDDCWLSVGTFRTQGDTDAEMQNNHLPQQSHSFGANASTSSIPVTSSMLHPSKEDLALMDRQKVTPELMRYTEKFEFPYITDVTNYEKLAKIGQGTFGEVFKARCKRTGRIVALKKILMENEKEGFPITALREVKMLQKLKHKHITELIEICSSRASVHNRERSTFYLVFSFCEHDLAARCKRTGRIVALKKILMENEKEGFPITALREVKMLQKLKHKHITELIEICSSRASVHNRERSTFYLVFSFCEHDLAGLLSNTSVRLSLVHIKTLMKHLLEGLYQIHFAKILHRDMKAANVLITKDGILKLADFGLARPLFSKLPGQPEHCYTNRVVTLWYRPPELLLGERHYGPQIDMWGAGCIMAELWTRTPILQGESEQKQLSLISNLCGSINPQTWRGVENLPLYSKMELQQNLNRRVVERLEAYVRDRNALNLIDSLLVLDPSLFCKYVIRITAFWSSHLKSYLVLKLENEFQGESEQKQLSLISNLCGSINPQTWRGVENLPLYSKMELQQNLNRRVVERLEAYVRDRNALNLIDSLLVLDPSLRLDAEQALDHLFFFTQPHPAADVKDLMSTISTSLFEYTAGRGAHSGRGRGKMELQQNLNRRVVERLEAYVRDRNALNLIDSLLVLDPSLRLDAEQALDHLFFFTQPHPAADVKDLMSTISTSLFEYTAGRGAHSGRGRGVHHQNRQNIRPSMASQGQYVDML